MSWVAVAAAVNYLASEAGVLEVVAQLVSDVTKATAIDETTLEIETDAPNVLLPRRLAGVRIPAPGHWKKLGRQQFAGQPIGTGPFVVEEWGASKLTLRANQTSWRRPVVDRAAVRTAVSGR